MGWTCAREGGDVRRPPGSRVLHLPLRRESEAEERGPAGQDYCLPIVVKSYMPYDGLTKTLVSDGSR